MFTANQLVAHMVGDYVLQSHWMATEKTKKTVAALAHALCYTVPFLLLTTSLPALGVIASSHFVIDRWRLARYVIWLKNWFGLPARVERCVYAQAKPDHVPETDMRVRSTTGGVGYIDRPLEWHNKPWSKCSKTGYPDDTPPWLSVWLLIITDNTMHLVCNACALRWL